MAIPQLNVYRHDKENRALVTLAGEIDLETVPLVRESLERCLRDGISTIDVDLTTVTFCDCSGVGAFLYASQCTAAAGGSLRLHHPRPPLAWLFAVTGTGTFLGLPTVLAEASPPLRSPPRDAAGRQHAPAAPIDSRSRSGGAS
jgi:anti-anti-sigma factor